MVHPFALLYRTSVIAVRRLLRWPSFIVHNTPLMEPLGQIGPRKIYYLSIRNQPNWMACLPQQNWVAFTIAHEEDAALVPEMVEACLDQNVSYTCSTGSYAHTTEDFFDESAVIRTVEYEMRTKETSDDYLMTTAHRNFEEGFWFATTLAYDDRYEIDQVVCLDLTKRGTKGHLTALVLQLNEGWLPDDGDQATIFYDS